MLNLVILVVAFVVVPHLERRFGPGGPRRSIRPNLVMPPLVMATAGIVGLLEVGSLDVVADRQIGLIPWLGLQGAAAWAVALAGLDFAGYAGHRLRHRLPFLWASHRMHHTDRDVDITTTLRHHPFDVAAVVVTSAVALLILGCTPAQFAAFGVLATVFGLFDHLRLTLPVPLERVLNLVIQTPGLHRVHHSPHRVETDSNFGLVLTLWDRLFGTYRAVEGRREVGLDTVDLDQRQTVTAMLMEPWRPLVRPTVGAADADAVPAVRVPATV